MSTQQQNELVEAVLREIESQSHSIDELQTVNSLEGVSSLPVKRNDDIVLVPLSLLTSSSNGIMPFQTSNPNDYSSSSNLKDYTDAKGGVIRYCSHANALRFYYIYNNAPYKRWYNSSLYNDESVGGTDKARTDTIFYNIQGKSLHIVKSGKFLEINGLQQTTGTSDYYPMSQKAVTTALNSILAESKSYTSIELANLVNSAPEHLNTLKELADAIQQNHTIVDYLDRAIGQKANATDLDTLIEEDYSINKNLQQVNSLDFDLIKQQDTLFDSRFIILKDGSIVQQTISEENILDECSLYTVPNRKYSNIYGVASTVPNGETVVLAFYKNDNLNPEGFISAVDYNESNPTKPTTFNIKVPQNCKWIVISQWGDNTTECFMSSKIKESFDEVHSKIEDTHFPFNGFAPEDIKVSYDISSSNEGLILFSQQLGLFVYRTGTEGFYVYWAQWDNSFLYNKNNKVLKNKTFTLDNQLYTYSGVTLCTIDELCKVEDVNLNQFNSLRADNHLIIGKKYRITDYHTFYYKNQHPFIDDIYNRFPVIVEADSTNSISKFAKTDDGSDIEIDIYSKPLYNAGIKSEGIQIKIFNNYLDAELIKIIDFNGSSFEEIQLTSVSGSTYYIYLKPGTLDKCLNNTVLPFTELNIPIYAVDSMNRFWQYDSSMGDNIVLHFNTLSFIPSATIDRGVGEILWMRDSYGNQAPWDFRSITWSFTSVTTDFISQNTKYRTFYDGSNNIIKKSASEKIIPVILLGSSSDNKINIISSSTSTIMKDSHRNDVNLENSIRQFLELSPSLGSDNYVLAKGELLEISNKTQKTKQDKETIIIYDETELSDTVNIPVNHRIIVKNPTEKEILLIVRGTSCFDFMTGDSIPTLTFMPSTIQWVKPLELKPNKRYLILFDKASQEEEPYYTTNLIGMWAEVDTAIS